MFDVTPEDIARLADDDLRELVARLATAELVRNGQSILAVENGGHQDAPDGGIDVRVRLDAGAATGPNLPRPNIGYQVKCPDRAHKAILQEMCPSGQLRPVIVELMAAGGAYIIVSAKASLTDGTLRARHLAMREALAGFPEASHLHTDFYDGTRVANWVREYPGLVLWVREKVGRALSGWRPYANWSNRSEEADASYLTDQCARVRFNDDETAVTDTVAIARLREMLRQPGSAVRLVGLSGVGKTRLVQALFDPNVGTGTLLSAAVVYTDFHELTSPQPEGMAEDLLAQGRHAILIIDNCGSATHARLTLACKEYGSKISLLTVEYDVRDGSAESTQVVEMYAASDSHIEDLLHRRYPILTPENTHTVARVSGGNARIALAIAETVRKGERLAELRVGAIFDRLFHQRNAPNDGLLRAAEACALVYSFDGVTEEGDLAELPVIAELAQMSLGELFRHVQTLRDRDLVQSRSNWRAVLPHALANHLAHNAFSKILNGQLRRHLAQTDNERLFGSFCHRLSFLHDCQAAVRWSEELLSPGGRLGQVLRYTPPQHLLLAYLAPVAPAAALAAIERAAEEDFTTWLDQARHAFEVLRLLAWEAAFFDRCVTLLERVVRTNRHRVEIQEPRKILVSFFQPYRSGTHAPVAIRFTHIARWLADPEVPMQQLGRLALVQAISTSISSHGNFNFGARNRDNGYRPATDVDRADWFRQGLALLATMGQAGGQQAEFARQTFTKSFKTLWAFPLLHGVLAQQMTDFSAGEFWREGWLAVRTTQQYGERNQQGLHLLLQLEAQLAPTDLAGRVLGTVLYGDGVFEGKREGEEHANYLERVAATVQNLGRETAHDLSTLRAVAQHLLMRPGRTEDFGIGLAQEQSTHQQVWDTMVPELESVIAMNNSNDPPWRTLPHVLRGFMMELVNHNRPLADQFLDQCSTSSELALVLPSLQAAAGFDAVGLSRVQQAYMEGKVPARELGWLRAASAAPTDVQQAALELLVQVAAAGHSHTAVNGLEGWLERLERFEFVPDVDLVTVCQQVLEHFTFAANESEDAFSVSRIAKVGIHGDGAAALVARLAARMGAASREYHMLASHYQELTIVLLEREPEAVLTALCQDGPRALSTAVELLGFEAPDGRYPIEKVEPHRLAAWCAVDPVRRLPLAVRVVPVVENDPVTGRARMTKQALELLRQSTAPGDTLIELADRMEWQALKNTRGAMITHNAEALDDAINLHDASFRLLVREAQERMRAAGARRIDVEAAQDRLRNERFE